MDLPAIPDANSSRETLTHFFESHDTEKVIDSYERDLFKQYGASESLVHIKTDMLQHAIDKARTRWACISALSQRKKKSRNGVSYQVEVYDTLTTIKPRFERDRGIKPPDKSGKVMHRFTPRSRQRLMNRARRLNKQELPLPFFVTLTYHKNFTDCIASKKHLNAFFQRWRRRHDDFAYFWKMEPQKRGAIHYHLCFFVPEELQKKIKRNRRAESVIDAMRLQVQDDWAEVTKDVDGVDVPFTRIDYIRTRDKKTEDYRVKGSTRKVKTMCANPRVEYKIEPDWQHRLYGTNVRRVDNWKMFLGYLYKYMGEELKDHPFGAPTLSGELVNIEPEHPAPPFRYSAGKPYGLPDISLQVNRKKTGRFWGFSYNLDFEALHTGFIDSKELENVNDFCNALNALTFASLTKHLTENAKRKKKELKDNPAELKKHLQRFRNTYEAQKKRFAINKEKIKRGYMMQFEINSGLSGDCFKYLKGKSIDEFFS